MPATRRGPSAATKHAQSATLVGPAVPAVAPPGGAICEICNKVISRKSDLNRHKKTHNPVKDFTCECCNRGWSNLQEYNIHLDRKAGIKPYECCFQPCEFRTADPASLTRHKKNIHGYVPQFGPRKSSSRSSKGKQRRVSKESEDSFRMYSDYWRSVCSSPSATSSASSSDLPATPSDRSSPEISIAVEELCLHDIGPDGIFLPWTFPWENLIQDPKFVMASPSSQGFFLHRQLASGNFSADPHNTHAAHESSSATIGYEQECQDSQLIISCKGEEQPLLLKSSSKKRPDHVDALDPELFNIHLPIPRLPFPFNVEPVQPSLSRIPEQYQVLEQQMEFLNSIMAENSLQHEQMPIQYWGNDAASEEQLNFDFTPEQYAADAANFAQTMQLEGNACATPEPTYQQLNFDLDLGTDFMTPIIEQQQQQEIPDPLDNTQYLYNGYTYQ